MPRPEKAKKVPSGKRRSAKIPNFTYDRRETIIRERRNIEVRAMKSSWRSETGHLSLRWTEAGQPDQYRPSWMKDCSEAQGGHIPPLLDFSDRSPFGGVSWFQPDPAGRNQAIFL